MYNIQEYKILAYCMFSGYHSFIFTNLKNKYQLNSSLKTYHEISFLTFRPAGAIIHTFSWIITNSFSKINVLHVCWTKFLYFGHMSDRSNRADIGTCLSRDRKRHRLYNRIFVYIDRHNNQMGTKIRTNFPCSQLDKDIGQFSNRILHRSNRGNFERN